MYFPNVFLQNWLIPTVFVWTGARADDVITTGRSGVERIAMRREASLRSHQARVQLVGAEERVACWWEGAVVEWVGQLKLACSTQTAQPLSKFVQHRVIHKLQIHTRKALSVIFFSNCFPAEEIFSKNFCENRKNVFQVLRLSREFQVILSDVSWCRVSVPRSTQTQTRENSTNDVGTASLIGRPRAHRFITMKTDFSSGTREISGNLILKSDS